MVAGRSYCICLLFFAVCAERASAAGEIRFQHVTTESGPSSGTINTVLRGSGGFLWLGTTNGLLRYDGHEFKTYRHVANDDTSISGNHVWSICEDVNGDLWVGTSRRGLNRYLRGQDRFLRYGHDHNDPGSLGGGEEVPWVYRDRQDQLWIALWEDGLDRFDRDTEQFLHHSVLLDDGQGTPRSSVQRVLQDHTGMLWLGTKRGVARFDPSDGALKLYRAATGPDGSQGADTVQALFEDSRRRLWVGARVSGLRVYDRRTDSFSAFVPATGEAAGLRDDIVTAIAEDRDGNLWIGTEERGLVLVNPTTRSATRFMSFPGDPGAIRSNHILSLHVDNRGILWIGYRDDGLGRHHPDRRRFAHYRPGGSAPGGQSAVNAVYERAEGSLWVGTDAGLAVYRPETGSFRFHQQRFREGGAPGGSVVSALTEDASGNLWVGVRGAGLYRLSAGGGFDCTACDRAELNKITTLMVDRNQRLWIGTDGDAISLYDPSGDRLIVTGSDSDSPFFSLRHVWALHEDRNGDIWIGVWGEGACRFREDTAELECFKHDPADSSSIASDVVISLAEDASGRMWFGSWGEGLSSLTPGTRRFERHTSSDGLPHDTVVGILAEATGRVWVSTLDGLARLDPSSQRWSRFDRRDGLQSQEFLTGSYHRGSSGRFYFGGPNGLNAFFPDQLWENRHAPPVALTEVRVQGRELPASLWMATAGERLPELRLPYHQNFVTFQFSALDFTDPGKNQHAYRLEGLEEEWVFAGPRRLAAYTDLDPGQYRFRVKASNNDGFWNEEGISLPLTITPPPWRTWWAYTLYLLAAAALFYGARRYELHRIRLANELKWQRLESRKLQELDQLKSRFFTDISHEFRTPLTLILGTLDSLKGTSDRAKAAGLHRRMERNAQRLLRLINELLDLSKLEAGAMTLRARTEDLAEVIRSVVSVFETAAADRNIRLRVSLPPRQLLASFDRDKLEKIVSNLIANALKFTPSEGFVKVSAGIAQATGDGESETSGGIVISVRDSGAGIPRTAMEHIFDRFYQFEGPNGEERPGTGVGLALTRELVQLHGGTIEVESQAGQGSCFKVTLPRGEAEPRPTVGDFGEGLEEDDGLSGSNEEAGPGSAMARRGDGARPLLLVVDDNPDMREYIEEILSSDFRIATAGDGETGLGQLFDLMPDLVISDVAMPGMDGFAFCQALKTDQRSSHIPVILLTARADERSRVAGLETGADDYVIKPFSVQELTARVKNLIEARRRLRERFQRSVTLEPAAVTITTADELFLKRALEVIRENLSDSDFKVDRFAAHFRLSRMQLHRKLKALTGQSVGEFIRHVRLRAAAGLLAEGKHTVTEVAFEVGFNNLSYFARCFRKQHGVSPSEYRRQA